VTVVVARAVKLGLTVSVAVGVAALTTSGSHAILLDVYLLSMGAVLLLALVRTTRVKALPARGSQLGRALAAMRRLPVDSGELALVREVELSTFGAFHLHTRLRHVLREIADHRLRAHYGVDLDREPIRARELVGARAWELVRPDRPPPQDRLSSGPSVAQLSEIVDELEEI